MPPYKVNRCICYGRSFEEIKEYARTNDIHSVEELQEIRFCSCGCRMCAPYVELMLQTGQTEFELGAYYKKKREN